MKILIADNEVLSRRLLEETLQKAGYEVLAVENGTAAVQELCKPDGPRLATRLGNARTGRTRCVPRSSKKNDPGYVYMILLTSKGLKPTSWPAWSQAPTII